MSYRPVGGQAACRPLFILRIVAVIPNGVRDTAIPNGVNNPAIANGVNNPVITSRRRSNL
jgi:hypothetical protein